MSVFVPDVTDSVLMLCTDGFCVGLSTVMVQRAPLEIKGKEGWRGESVVVALGLDSSCSFV